MDISNARVNKLLASLQENHIPIHLSVALVCKLKGINMTELAEDGGRHRSYLRQTLTGVFQPADDFRQHITDRLGADPWLYVPSK